MSEFPKMLYRDGTETRVWNKHDVDTRIVEGAEQEEKALANGWRLTPDKKSPLDHDGDGKPGGSVDALDQMKDDELRAKVEAKGITLHHRAGRAKMLQILREAA